MSGNPGARPTNPCVRCGTSTRSLLGICIVCQRSKRPKRERLATPTDNYRSMLSPEARQMLEQREREGWR